jgi:maltose alpha-D-glucosyltransferase/alpha-amylase
MLDGDPRRLKQAFSLLFALPGIPLLVYGDELGMGDDLTQAEREAARPPMQWNGGPFAGFSTVAPGGGVNPLIEGGPFGYERINVDSQLTDDGSLLCFVRILGRLRQERPELGQYGPETGVIPLENDRVLAYQSGPDSGRLVTLHNFSGQKQRVALDELGVRFDGVLLAGNGSGIEPNDTVTLGPYGYYWFNATRLTEAASRT